MLDLTSQHWCCECRSDFVSIFVWMSKEDWLSTDFNTKCSLVFIQKVHPGPESQEEGLQYIAVLFMYPTAANTVYNVHILTHMWKEHFHHADPH